ncbi:MAG: hypothetical protein GXP25_01885 [Planctomycetes bacterium]|nr:hypothetical protein [Planctomycetota bacterium]
MIVPMSRIEIVGPKSAMERATQVLHAEGALHLEHVPLVADGYRSFLHRVHLTDEQEKERQFIEDLVGTLAEVVAFIPTSIKAQTETVARCTEALSTTPPAEIFADATALARNIRSLVRRRNNIQDDLQTVAHYRNIFQALIPLFPRDLDGEGSNTADNREFIAILLDRGQEKAISLLREQMEEITKGDYAVHTSKLAENRLCGVITFEKKYAKKVKNLLWSEGVNELALPSEFRGKSLLDSLEAIQKRAKELPRKIQTVRAELDTFLRENGARMLAIHQICLDRLSQLNAVNNFATSTFTFVIDAWAPTTSVNRIRKRLANEVNEAIDVREIRRSGINPTGVPVKLSNHPWIKPFELLLSVFSPPTYGTIDPTILVAIIFPLFYGFILGDIGYGAIILALALFLRHRYRHIEVARSVCWIASCCAVSSILFGIVFGEFFGSLGIELGIIPSFLPLWEERMKIMNELLAIAILTGVFHVGLGLIIGMYHSLKKRDGKHFGEKFGMFLGFLGFLFAAEAHFQLLLSPTVAGYLSGGLLLMAVVIIAVSVGFLGAIEILSIASNILSYSRLMAIGIASIVLADIANRFAHNAGNLILGVLVGGIIHTVNLVMGIFSPVIQSLRLQYVEFLPKFYKPDGRDYNPFGRR